MKIETLLLGFIVLWICLVPFAIISAIGRYNKAEKIEYTQKEHTENLKKVRNFLGYLRFFGWMFFVVGMILLLASLPTLLDSEGIILVNGEPRTDIWTKTYSFIFDSIFPIIGSVIVFTPKRKMEEFLLGFVRFSERFARSQLDPTSRWR